MCPLHVLLKFSSGNLIFFPVQGKGVRSQLWYVLLVHMENKRMVQTAEILGLIICFAIHFFCVTIE